jgi:iron(II)-dependent oxidoreductase
MKTKITLVAILAMTTGAFFCTRPHSGVPSDLRDAVADSAISALKAEGGEQDVKVPEPEIKPFYVETGSRRGFGNKGYVTGNNPSAGAPVKPVEWVAIPAGKFTMGTDSGEKGFLEDAKPIHEVTIKTFDMSKTAVTVEQYAECVIKGGCTEPGAGDYCNWGKSGRQLHPINCVDWNQAQAYAKFKGARLPSEAEFEYAATSGGKNQKYPWGNDEPTCDKVVMKGNGGYGCGANGTMPVCSKPKGNTAQGLCDMSGNVWQWVQDKYHDSYKGVPVDGSASEGVGYSRVVRGGSFIYFVASRLRVDFRASHVPDMRYGLIGFRLAKSREEAFVLLRDEVSRLSALLNATPINNPNYKTIKEQYIKASDRLSEVTEKAIDEAYGVR